MMSLCLPLFSACSDDSGPDPICDSSYIPNCNAANTAILSCRLNAETEKYQLVETRCDYGCDAVLNQCKAAPGQEPVVQCTDVTHPKACKADKSGYTMCEGGVIKEVPCGDNQICDDTAVSCVSKGDNPVIVETCTDETLPPRCDGNTLVMCDGGLEINVICGVSATCDAATKSCKRNAAVDEKECDPASFKAECDTPLKVKTCGEDGRFKYETCSAGTMCNAELPVKSCKVPVENEACNPASFSETCRDNDKGTIYCEDNKVVFFDCVENYGDNYKCDIAEGHDGPGLNVTMCYDPKDASMQCTSVDDAYSECEYDAKEDKHITSYYQCARFNLGYHFYLADVVECGAGACNSDNTACKEQAFLGKKAIGQKRSGNVSFCQYAF